MFLQYRFRRDTSANWTTNNPVIASGELVLVTDLQGFKAGDGVSAYTQLSMYNAQGASAYDIAVANGFVGTEQQWLDSLVGEQGPPGLVPSELIQYDLTEGNAFVGTNLASTNYLPFAAEIQSIILTANPAPEGANLIADLNVDGVSILSTKISVDATESNSTTAAVPHVLTTTSLPLGCRISIDIDQVGVAPNPGANVQMFINLVRV